MVGGLDGGLLDGMAVGMCWLLRRRWCWWQQRRRQVHVVGQSRDICSCMGKCMIRRPINVLSWAMFIRVRGMPDTQVSGSIPTLLPCRCNVASADLRMQM